MIKDIKVSIIIPIYNTASYLHKCLDSVFNQSLQDIEIICIDDGSTDDSAEILQDYSQKDARIKILTQENSGQSVARNAGMQIATGEYIGFVDSDDWADERMFEKLYLNAKAYDSDVSMCSINVYNEKTGGNNPNDTYMTLDLFSDAFENRAFSPQETYDFIFRICVVPWNKLYRKAFLRKIDVKFPQGLFFEDNVFFYAIFFQSDKVSLLKENLYNYRVGTGESTVSGNDKKKLDIFAIFILIEEFLKEKGFYERLSDYFETYKKNTLIYWYKKINDESVKKEFGDKLLSLNIRSN